jgi:hypothetical protein
MTNNKQQMAVDWFLIKLLKDGYIKRLPVLEFQQAKEMEKEQAIKFALCYAYGQYNVSEDLRKHIEKFYNETYGNDKQ